LRSVAGRHCVVQSESKGGLNSARS
jgi:hypothetical protein